MDSVYIITTLAAENATIDPTQHSTLNAVQVASLLIGVFIPILVGLVTKVTTSPALKSILLLALSAVSGFLTEFVNSANFIWQQALLTTVVTFVIGVATYYGLWTPTGVTAKAQAAFSQPKNEVGQMPIERVLVIGILAIIFFVLLAWAL
jgi:hypothetical protein